jgi:hypothetical protein
MREGSHRMELLRAPRICLRDHILLLAVAAVVVSFLLAWEVTGSAWRETVAVGSALAGLLTIYYTVMLYGGFRYDSGRHRWTWSGMQWRDLGDVPTVDFGGCDFSFDAGGDLFGTLIAGLLALVWAISLAIALVVLAWIGVNLVSYVVYLLWIPTYIVLRYGVRLALVNRKRAQGDFMQALGIGLLHGACGGVVLGLCFWLIDVVIRLV